MIAVGDTFPEVTVYRSPGEAVSLPAVANGSRAIFAFYLFDFSGT